MFKVTKFQQGIVDECLDKGSGTISVPMGTGKTFISTTVANQQMRPSEKCLIVCQLTLIDNWKREIEKFFGSTIKYVIFHQSVMDTSDYILEHDVKYIITTPEMLIKTFSMMSIAKKFTLVNKAARRADGIQDYALVDSPLGIGTTNGRWLYSTRFGCLIIDEIQHYISVKTLRCLALASLCARHRWGLSGTVFNEPKLERLFGYYLIINDKIAPRNLFDFKKYITSRDFPGVNASMVVRKENIQFIPPKINKVFIENILSPPEMIIYQALQQIFKIITDRLNDLKARGKDKDNDRKLQLGASRLVLIGCLKQFIVSPLAPYTSMLIRLSSFATEDDEVVGIFNKVLSSLNLTNYLNNPDSIISTRIQQVLRIVNLHRNERIILFTSFRTNLDLMNHLMMANGTKTFTIESTDSPAERGDVLKAFEESPNGVLLLTYQLGATGLNLQFCKTLLLTDFEWNDGITQQAIARILRFGQQAPMVNLYYFKSNTGMEKVLFDKHVNKLDILKEIETGPLKKQIKRMNLNQFIELVDPRDVNVLLER